MLARSYQASAPGRLMLFGEHAVLAGKIAVLAAIDKRVSVALTPRSDRKIKISSRGFAHFVTDLQHFKIVKPYRFVLTAVARCLPRIKSGFDLKIDSQFASTLGLGSSAAVTVATLAVLEWWLKQRKPKALELLRMARDVIRQVQGFGSGADAAASIFGGVIAYQPTSLRVKKIATHLPLSVVYSGSKMTTPVVIKKVRKLFVGKENLLHAIYALMAQCTLLAIKAIKKKNWYSVGEMMNLHQALQDALGVNNSILSELIFALRAHPGIYGAKISGSGLGDCVIGLGKLPKNTFPENKSQKQVGVQKIEAKIAKSGLVFNY